MSFPQVGQILPNGHTVDATYCVGDARYVLAHRHEAPQQYVVWNVDQGGDTVNGRYFSDPAAAQKKFAECCFDWWEDLSAEYPQIVSEDRQTILESTMEQLRPVLQKVLLTYGVPDTVSVDNPDAAEIAVSEDFSARRPDRQQTIQAVIRLIIERMEEKNKGNLTTRYVIGILQEAITRLEANALMSPAKDYLLKAES